MYLYDDSNLDRNVPKRPPEKSSRGAETICNGLKLSITRIISIIKEQESGLGVPELCRKYSIGQPTFTAGSHYMET